jgi:ABC-type multidrug transport system ATPase subunit
MNELKVTGLTKRYGEKVALNDFSYTFTDGVYGLLGPNGAGKSTMMNILTDNVIPENGEIQFNGVDRKKNMVDYRSCLGFMPQQQQLYASMSLERFLFYMAALKGIKKDDAAGQIDDILKVVNLEDVRRRAMGTFSGGMKQRALIAQATLGNPSLLILDEPTAGLDPAERIRIRNLISEISFNRIVIIATHITSEIEMIAKEVLFLQQGQLKESGDVSTVCERIQGKVFEVQADIGQWKELVSRYLVSNIRREGDRIVMRVVSDTPPDMEGTAVFPTLEDVYLYLYGNKS